MNPAILEKVIVWLLNRRPDITPVSIRDLMRGVRHLSNVTMANNCIDVLEKYHTVKPLPIKKTRFNRRKSPEFVVNYNLLDLYQMDILIHSQGTSNTACDIF